jgi:ferredoxin-NADP reductase
VNAVVQSVATLADIKPWDSLSEELECTMVLDNSADVKSFCFQTSRPSWFRYAAGQFVTIEVEIAGRKHVRCYTLSSSPSRPVCLTITVKAEPGGTVSNWLHANLKVGHRIRAGGPAGIFSVDLHPANKYLFLSGGVGITPLMSMTRWLFDLGRHTDVCFIQCARTPADLLCRSELEAISAQRPEFRVALVCERPNPYGAWTGYSGRINQLMLELICSDYREREVFCCGPEPFMQAVRDFLRVAGYNMARYHEESFSAPVHDASEANAHVDDVRIEEARTAQVSFAVSNRQVECREADTLLDIARSVGLHIPSACLLGVCGSCKVRKLEGQVHMVHNGGIADEDVTDGWVLACCSRPLGRVVLAC